MMADNIAGEELRQILERIEHKEAEKADVTASIAEDYADAKGRGFDVKIIRLMIARRKKGPDDVAEADAILEMYETAILGA